MEAVKLRETVLSYIADADERLLKVVKAVVESYNENDNVAYHPDGKPMHRIEYKKALERAENQVAEGDFNTAESYLNEDSNFDNCNRSRLDQGISNRIKFNS